MKNIFNKLDDKYEIYQDGINWYVILFAAAICIISTLLLRGVLPSTTISLINLLTIMPLSPLAALKFRKRKINQCDNNDK